MTKKKMTTIPKSQIPKTKNTERKALFRGRVNTEAIQDQDSTTATATHSHALTLPRTISSVVCPISDCVKRLLHMNVWCVCCIPSDCLLPTSGSKSIYSIFFPHLTSCNSICYTFLLFISVVLTSVSYLLLQPS